MPTDLMSGSCLHASRDGRVATVRLAREAQRNALSAQTLRELDEVARLLRVDPDVSVVVLTGGSRQFSAGADKRDPEIFAATGPGAQRRGLLARTDVARAWEDLPQVTIAAIEGYAVGGALTLALCCDFRVIGQGAFVSAPEIDMGLSYGWNTIPRLVALLGPALARRVVLMGERIPAEQALDWRLVDFVCPDGTALERSLEIAAQLARKSRLALEIDKRSLNAAHVGLTHLLSHGDADQSILCRMALLDEAARSSPDDARA